MRHLMLRALIVTSTLAFALPAAAQAPKGDTGGDKREGRDKREGGDRREGDDKREGRDKREGGDKREGRDKREGGDKGGEHEGREGGEKREGGGEQEGRGRREGREGGGEQEGRGRREGREGRDAHGDNGGRHARPWGAHRERDDGDDDDDDDGRSRRGRGRWGHEGRGRDWRGHGGRGHERRGRDDDHRGRRGGHPWSRDDRPKHHDDEHEERSRTPYGWGGLGYASVGFMHGSFHFLDEALRDPAALGPGYERSDTAFTFGGGGGALIGRRLWVGGKGFGFILPTESSDRGRARINGGGGGFELGLAAINRPHAIVIPYIGVGGLATSVTVRNRTAAAMSVGGVPLLPPGEDRTFSSGFWTLDAGIRAFGVYFPGGGGWAAGVDLGITTALAPNSFELDGNPLSGVAPARMTAGYLRLMLGGGGFFVPGRR
jgi:hypothetical protein